MYHFTYLTCCKDHKKGDKGGKAINLGAGKGGGNMYEHMVLTVLRQAQYPFNFLFAGNPQVYLV